MKIVVISLMVLVIFVLFGGSTIDFLFDEAASIDICLDNGGAWDYEQELCRYE